MAQVALNLRRAEPPFGSPLRVGEGQRERRPSAALGSGLSMATGKIMLAPGDGIGPEITAQGAEVLEHVASRFGHEIELFERPLGGGSIDAHGVACTDETLQDARDADAVLLGAVGGPKWDDPHAEVTPEGGVLRLRRELGLYSNVRPVRVHDDLVENSPLRPELVRGTDLVIFRELTGGLYFGEPKEMRFINGEPGAIDTLVYRRSEVERIVRRAFEWARGRRRNRKCVYGREPGFHAHQPNGP